MKKNWISLLVAVSIGLVGCIQEDFHGDATDNNGPEESILQQAEYLGFQLKDAEISTRSTHKEYDDDYERFEWFNKGTADERAIIDNPECNRVLFFYSDYSYYGSGKLQRPASVTVPENVFVAKRPVITEELPAYALVVLNGDPKRLDNLDIALSAAGTDAVKTVLNYFNEVDTDAPESMAQYNGYFTMSSTMYSTEEGSIAGLKSLRTDTPVFYETIEEAVLPENLTTFNVERILAKFTLIIKEGNKKFGTGEAINIKGLNTLKVRKFYQVEKGEEEKGSVNGGKDFFSSWSINLVNWGVNGLEKNTWLIKRIALNPTEYPWMPDGNFYSGWNSPSLFRSYWSIDENYSSGIYPDQYRQALDDAENVKSATTNNIYSSNYLGSLEKGDYTLIYKPYSAYTDRTENKYSVENTFDESILSEQDLSTQPWLRRGTHILLTAQFLIDEIDTEVDKTKVDENGFLLDKVADKYFSNGLYWSESALLQQAVATLMTNLYYNKEGNSYKISNVLGEGYVDYINENGKPPLDTDCPVEDGNGILLTHEFLMGSDETTGELNVYKYFEFAPAFIKGGDGWVTLKKKDDVTLYARYIDKSIRKITDEQLVSYIYRFTNLAKHYKEGRMYYAIPIRHNLDSPNFETSPVTKASTGDYGVVRNTWYRMTINSILSPGTPVDDPDQPIIPNPEPDDKSLGVEVEIIPWRTVDINVEQLH